MKFSSRARYGLRAMLELALNYNPEETMPLVQIAEKQGISEGYLEQMMTLLRRGGLVRSVRGAQGGYRLNREPGKITVGEIVRCLEGPLSPTGCVSEDDPETCNRADYAYVIETGEIVLQGSARELMHSEEVKKAYLGG
jgi:Rrf2 family cysteine metabolism transcriptional repressor